MKPKRCNGWAWRPPAEPDPGHVLTGQAAHLAARQMHGDEPNGPPGEDLWAGSLGQRFAELIRDTN